MNPHAKLTSALMQRRRVSREPWYRAVELTIDQGRENRRAACASAGDFQPATAMRRIPLTIFPGAYLLVRHLDER
jgi:hypothetical protein